MQKAAGVFKAKKSRSLKLLALAVDQYWLQLAHMHYMRTHTYTQTKCLS